ncbi:MAG: glycoside hydrolase family 9 protein [Bacteroidales bacterium]|jgi:endoglucanase|nr:glycoside hydrolase family 9 protein [Bacteroidales bacterium]
MIKKYFFLSLSFLLLGTLFIQANPTFKEVRTASNSVLVAFFTSDTVDINEINIDDVSKWKINGESAKSIHKYVMQANACNHHIYLETTELQEGKMYTIESPYGTMDFQFKAKEIFCESIKTNQVGYSAQSNVRYANFAIWTGTGGSKRIIGALPKYEVINLKTGKSLFNGKLKEIGADTSSGDFVYRIDLAHIPEGGPYKIAVKGFGCSYPFGIGGEFSKRLAHTIFRAQYLQRCGCPIDDPDLRKDPCHTIIYKVNGPIGEANIDVIGNEPTFKCYGGYHDAGDADRRAYHMENPVLNLMIYEAFPKYFTDGQYHIPGDFTEDYHIVNYENNIPDIIDEAAWGTLAWEYLQNEDGSIQFGTETRGYPHPFAAPLDQDNKKYGTVKIDDRAATVGAGLFMHLARILKPYQAQHSAELVKRAEKAMRFSEERMADPEKLYYHIQRYLLLKQDEDRAKINELYKITDGLKDNLYITPGYSINDDKFDNPAYIYSYIVAKDVPTDPAIVAFFKKAIKDAADSNIAELKSHAYPVGNYSARGGWGHNVRQPQYAAAPLLYWQISKDQKYFDAASELMDFKLGLNPIGISYVTGLGFHQVYNIHDRESAYTENLGWGSKPGITAFGPGVIGRRNKVNVIPSVNDLPKERQYTDDRALISFNEFTIFETMHYDALYTILSGGGKWNNKDPFKSE